LLDIGVKFEAAKIRFYKKREKITAKEYTRIIGNASYGPWVERLKLAARRVHD